MTVSAVATKEISSRRGGDSITWYLTSIGREPLLTPAEEIELGNQVQAMMQLMEGAKERLLLCRRRRSSKSVDAPRSA